MEPNVKVLREYMAGHSFLKAKFSNGHSAPPLVFIHGVAGFAGYFVRFMERMARTLERTGYAIDIMGHGDHIEKDIRDASIKDYVADVAHFIRRVVMRDHTMLPILVGHSMGGLIALALTARGYAERSVLITPAPPKGISYRPGKILVPSLDDIQKFMLFRLFGTPFQVSANVLKQIFVNPVRDRALITELADEYQANESLTVLDEIYNSTFEVDPRAVKAPLLVVRAGKDAVLHPDACSEIANEYRAELISFADRGHLCIIESGWEHVADSLAKWISIRK
jgi:pimeloyl-ACP methyl ester carboxylesterase